MKNLVEEMLDIQLEIRAMKKSGSGGAGRTFTSYEQLESPHRWELIFDGSVESHQAIKCPHSNL